jgi:hypothetical protein
MRQRDAKRRPAWEPTDVQDQPGRRSAPNSNSGVSASSDLAVGDSVRCERATPARGTWRRYSGRTGIVVAINARDGEYGVSFTDDAGHVDAWFLLTELAVIGGAHPAGRRLAGAEAEVTS